MSVLDDKIYSKLMNNKVFFNVQKQLCTLHFAFVHIYVNKNLN